MMPRLQAEERLNEISDRAIAAGTATPELSRNAIRELKKRAEIERPVASRANASALVAMGIGVTDLSEASEEAPRDG